MSSKVPMNFKTMAQIDVPKGREGKHKEVVTQILSDLDQMKAGSAIKIPLKELTESKAKVRSALNRVTRRDGRSVATASDSNYLYVWNVQTEQAK
jgi:DNA helicase TIP49 (TBP-interacting protein)